MVTKAQKIVVFYSSLVTSGIVNVLIVGEIYYNSGFGPIGLIWMPIIAPIVWLIVYIGIRLFAEITIRLK
jgi:hypothetical protein